MGIVRILHISDIHFRKVDNWDRQPIVDALCATLKDLPNPDLIALTGDLAFSGKAAEYKLAEAWIREKLWPAVDNPPLERLLLVPGNHDVDRSLVKGSIRNTHDVLLKADAQEVKKYWSDKDEKKLLLKSQRSFTACQKRLTGRGAPWWSARFQINGVDLGVAGLNSAWLSSGDEDYGRLRLSRYQIQDLLPKVQGAQVVLALLHHPSSWTVAADQTDYGLLRQHCHLILRGHEHQQVFVQSSDARDHYLELAAGSVYEHARYANAFYMLEIDTDANRVRVQPYLWDRNRWIADNNLFLKDPEFILDPTREPKEPKPEPPVPDPKPESPVPDPKPEPQTSGLPFIHRMPLHPNPHFVGREQVLEQLTQSLAAHGDIAIAGAAAVKGMGGIGKTQLAVRYAYTRGHRYPGGVFWLNFDRANAVSGEVAACGPALGLYSLDDRISEAEKVRRVREVWDSAGPSCLLIFDNCEDPELWKQWRPKGATHHALITSRRQDWDGIAQVPLDTLARPESVTLLQKLAPHLQPKEAEAVAEAMGDLPLALHLAGSYLHRFRLHKSTEDYLQDLKEKGLTHSSMDGKVSLPTDHESNVRITFCHSLDTLDGEADALVFQLLAHALWFAPGEPIPQKALLDSLETDLEPAMDALTVAQDLGLLKPEDDELTIHRLVAQALRESLPEATITTAETTVSQWVFDTTDGLYGTLDYIPSMAPLVPHLRYLADHWFHRETALTARLCNVLATYLDEVNADYPAAETYARRALTVGETVFGAEASATATYLNNLAQLLQTTGRLEEAEPLMRRALTISETTFGPDHPDVALRLNNLALLLKATGRLVEAEPLYRRALTIDETTFGPDHPGVAIDLNNLASLLHDTGRLDEAEPLYRRALTIGETTFGPDHPKVALRLNNLALLLKDTGRLEEAEPLMRRAVAIDLKVFREGHPQTLRHQNSLKILLAQIAANNPPDDS